MDAIEKGGPLWATPDRVAMGYAPMLEDAGIRFIDYSGDFRWESHRLGRIVILSARPEDSEGLEDFLIREFFGTPTVGPGR